MEMGEYTVNARGMAGQNGRGKGNGIANVLWYVSNIIVNVLLFQMIHIKILYNFEESL